MTTARADLAGGVETVYLLQLAAVPPGFVIQHVQESTPAHVGNTAAELMVPDHVGYAQVFHHQSCLGSRQLGGGFMEEIVSNVEHPSVAFGYSKNTPLSPVRSFNGPGQLALAGSAFLSPHGEAARPAGLGTCHPIPRGAASVVSARGQPRLAAVSSRHVDPPRRRHRAALPSQTPRAQNEPADGRDEVQLPGSICRPIA